MWNWRVYNNSTLQYLMPAHAAILQHSAGVLQLQSAASKDLGSRLPLLAAIYDGCER